ncbi:putative 3-dehydroshikimate dehydratase [Cystobasidium minutum MCA 4210]|uniref:putative 3-dehydroshikimate dehydratase n=1 Tax=Cystobasidium minutum MCA 4210 TaxID=1397322 RepID=UPI0034CD7E79|eukprot:jgi/Rhomi1/197387/gm1.5601_g
MVIKVPLCYATPSCGMHKNHTLPMKLEAIAQAGFDSIELGMPDLQAYAQQQLGSSFTPLSEEDGSGDLRSLIKIAEEVKQLCQDLKLEILCLQPFSQFEGYKDDNKREARLRKAKVWMDVMEALGTDMLQVGSTDDKESTSDRETIVQDLTELADLAAKRGMRIGYEMWCWAAHNDTWKDIWEICKAVDRPNFGLCLDTFQITGREWADPSEPDGLLAGFASAEERNAALTKSLNELSTTIPADKIFYFQISDAQKMNPPINEKHPAWDGETPARGLWSHDYRPLPYQTDKGAYLPVEECTAAVLKTGYRGPFSYEVFYGEDMSKDDPKVPERWAQDSMKCHKRLMEACEKLIAA